MCTLIFIPYHVQALVVILSHYFTRPMNCSSFSLQFSQQHHLTVNKQLRVMENRLDKVPSLPPPTFLHSTLPLVPSQALVRFSSALAANGQLRDRIDHMRQEKRVFEGLHKKLQRVCPYQSYPIIFDTATTHRH